MHRRILIVEDEEKVVVVSDFGQFALANDDVVFLHQDFSVTRSMWHGEHVNGSPQFTIDVLADSVIANDSLPWGVEGLFLDRRLGKLFMCGTDPARTLIYDCNQRAIVDTIDVGYDGAGLFRTRDGGVTWACLGLERTACVLDALPRDATFDWVDRVSIELTTMMLATLFDFGQARWDLVVLTYHPGRVATRSYGEDRPAVTGHDDSAWSKNRRDDFVLLHAK